MIDKNIYFRVAEFGKKGRRNKGAVSLYFVFGFLIIFVILVGAGVAWKISKDNELAMIVNFDKCVAAGYPITENYPPQCRTSDGRIFTQNIGNELEKVNLIKIENPRPNQQIKSPLEIRGEARGNWYFEASFPARLLDANGKELALIPVTALGEWMTEEFVPFRAIMNFTPPETSTGTLILEKDNPSGLPENADSLVVPVRFYNDTVGNSVATTTSFFVFFGKTGENIDCNQVFSVRREVPMTLSVGRAAIGELLKGPTSEEKRVGFLTSINAGVRLNSLTIENKIAKADFSEDLDKNIGGSCRVTAIRAQISETLKQFPTVEEVVISVNGRTEDILQP